MSEQILLFRGNRPATPNQREAYYDPLTEKLSTVDDNGDWVEREVNALAVIEAQKGQIGGIATLDAGGTIPTGQLPALSITDTSVVGSESAMLALSAGIGDVAVRTDLNKSFILKVADASVLDHWQELLTPTDLVLSVNGYTGAVSLTKTDVGLSNADNTADLDKPVSTAVSNALATKETPTGSQAKVDSHAAATTGVHGVGAGTIAKVSDIGTDANLSSAGQDAISKKHTQNTDTGTSAANFAINGSNAIKEGDARLTDARVPVAHNQNASTINAGTLDGDILPALSATKKGGAPATGTPSNKYLRDDNTWQSPPGGSEAFPVGSIFISVVATNQPEAAHTHSLGGSGTALDVVNPYIVCYFWKRTA